MSGYTGNKTYTVLLDANGDGHYDSQEAALSYPKLLGAAVIAKVLWGAERGKRILILQGGQLVDLGALVRGCGCVILEGDPAFDLDPEQGKLWTTQIKTAGYKGRLKAYTVRLLGCDESLLVHFDNREFYAGLKVVGEWLGVDLVDQGYIRDLHFGNTAQEEI